MSKKLKIIDERSSNIEELDCWVEIGSDDRRLSVGEIVIEISPLKSQNYRENLMDLNTVLNDDNLIPDEVVISNHESEEWPTHLNFDSDLSDSFSHSDNLSSIQDDSDHESDINSNETMKCIGFGEFNRLFSN